MDFIENSAGLRKKEGRSEKKRKKNAHRSAKSKINRGAKMVMGARPQHAARRQEGTVLVARDFLEKTDADIRDLACTNESTGFLEQYNLLVEEAVQNGKGVRNRLELLNKQKESSRLTWAVEYRYRHTHGDLKGNERFIRESIRTAKRDEEKSLLCLSFVRKLWSTEADLLELRGLLKSLDRIPQQGPLATVLRGLMEADLALESSDLVGAANAYSVIAEDERLPAHIRTTATLSLAFLYTTHGKVELAIQYLRQLHEKGALPVNVYDTLIYLASTRSETELLKSLCDKFLVDQETSTRVDRSSRALLAALAGNREDALNLIGGVLRENPNDVYALERTLEWTLEYADYFELGFEEKYRAGLLTPKDLEDYRAICQTIIDLLNIRLDTDLSIRARIATLCRLGQYYELEEDEGQEAAADVYRQALELDPTYPPPYRALGRLYSQNNHWDSLVALYEREIHECRKHAEIWRRHFEVAEIYENKLDAKRKVFALSHYLAVLKANPGYLPALQGACRIYQAEGKYAELCDLFLDTYKELACSEKTFSIRQRLYLLGTVARVADEQLNRASVAIDAWKIILELYPEHPEVYAKLGRLYSQEGRWEELLHLNEEEIDLMVDPEERAAMMVTNARICETRFGDLVGAEGWYSEALDQIPGYLPALEGLSQIYRSGERWQEVIEMTDAQLANINDRKEKVRQLSALAEIYLKLREKEKAVETYRRLLLLSPNDPLALEVMIQHGLACNDFTLVENCRERLFSIPKQDDLSGPVEIVVDNDTDYDIGRLDDADTIEVNQRRSQYVMADDEVVTEFSPTIPIAIEQSENNGVEYRLASSNAYMYEFRSCVYGDANKFWRHALEAAPEDPHALDGYVRTALFEKIPLRKQSNFLNKLSESLPDGTAKQRIQLALARIAECSQDSLAMAKQHRLQSCRTFPETEYAIHFAMASAPERRTLNSIRTKSPLSDLELLGSTVLGRDSSGDNAVRALDVVLSCADQDERVTALSICDPTLTRHFINQNDTPSLLFLADLYSCVDRQSFDQIPKYASQHRLRALAALQNGHFETYCSETEAEISSFTGEDGREVYSSELMVSRLTEIANRLMSTDKKQARYFLQRAVSSAYSGEVDCHMVVDTPILDRLDSALRTAEAWDLLRCSLSSHLWFDNLESARRTELIRELAILCEEKLGEFDSAQFLWSALATLETGDAFRNLARVSARCEDYSAAINAWIQIVNYHCATEKESVEGLLELVKFYKLNGEREMAIRLLDGDGLSPGFCNCFSDRSLQSRILSASADLHLEQAADVEDEDERRSELEKAALLLGYIFNGELEEQIDFCREMEVLVALYREQLNQPEKAYIMQWNYVYLVPSSSEAIEQLLELAEEIDQLLECCDRLVDFAIQHLTYDFESYVRVLTETAIAYDERLARSDMAIPLYEKLLDILPPERSKLLRNRHAFALAKIPGSEEHAHRSLRLLAKENPFDSKIYRELSLFYEHCRAPDRQRIVTQILEAIGCVTSPIPSYASSARTIPDGCLRNDEIGTLLLKDILPFGLIEILRAAQPVEEVLLGSAAEFAKSFEGESLGDSTKIYHFFKFAFSLFGIDRFKLVIGEGDLLEPQVFSTSIPSIWLNDCLVDDNTSEAELRFIAGWCAALAWSQISMLLQFNTEEVYHAIEALHIKTKNVGFSGEHDFDSDDELDGAWILLSKLNKKYYDPLGTTRKRIINIFENHREAFFKVHHEYWDTSLRIFAARVALLMAGDVNVSVKQILKFQGISANLSTQEGRQIASENELASEIVRYALTDEYLNLRYACKLDSLPSRIISMRP